MDTNVVSEIAKTAPDSRVIAFLTNEPDLWLSAIVLPKLVSGEVRVVGWERSIPDATVNYEI